MSNIYSNLKATLRICPKENKLSYYQILSSSKLSDDLKFKDNEEGLVSYLIQLMLTSRSGYNKNSIENIKNSLGIKNYYDERDLFTKLFMRDYESKNNNSYKLRENIDIRDLFNIFSSFEFKRDLDFAKTIVSLDGKYLKCMDINIRSNIDIVKIAIENDSSKDIDSFISADGDAIKNSELALLYLKRKKENNSSLNIEDIYENILKKNPDGTFINNIFKNNVQSYWLSNNDFLAGLLNLSNDFVKYITQGKISLTTSNDKEKQKIKK